MVKVLGLAGGCRHAERSTPAERYHEGMRRNDEVAALFDEIADRLSLLGESWFKVRAYRRAADSLRAAAEEVDALSAAGRLGTLPGVGKAIVEKTAAYLATGHIPLLDRLRAEVPDGLLALLRAGLTPAQVREVRDRLGADSPEALRAALARGGDGLSPGTLRAARAAVAGERSAARP
jgi:DNA polymerase/3'-5' exonuclease PolX